MKTLLATGSVLGSPDHGQARLWRWWYYYHQHHHALGADYWAACNNGDTHLPVEWFVRSYDAALPVPNLEPARLTVLYHAPFLPRQDIWNCDGFWRSLETLVRVCQEQAFERFILIEGDAFILNPDLLHEIGATTTGLVTYWCPTYEIPETGIVIGCAEAYPRLREQIAALRAKSGRCTAADRFEVAMDWTLVRKYRMGDRYPELGSCVPAGAQYCCQLPPWAIVQEGGGIEGIIS